MLTAEPGRVDEDVPTATRSDVPGRLRAELLTYLSSAALTVLAVVAIMRLWRAHPSIPFWYTDGALAAARYFKTTAESGWYARQPALGVPFGQHDQYVAAPGDLNALMIKVLTSLTGRWAVAFNAFFLIGFPLAAIAAVWFFRSCGLRPWFSVVLSVLFAVAPYHFLRNETQIFLSSYFCLPLVMVLAVRAVRGRPLWGRREHARPVLALLTGRGAGTVAVLLVLACSGGDYALFGGLLLGFAGLCGVLRSHSRRQLGGLVAAAAVLGAAYLLAVLPALVRSAGSTVIGPSVRSGGAETYAMKLASLLLPSPGEPIGFLSRARATYDQTYPAPGETPALGFVAACGFVVLLLVAITAVTGRRGRSDGGDLAGTTDPTLSAAVTFRDLTLLAVFTFCLGTVGGLGTIVSVVIGGFDDWGRISILLALLCLAAVGLAVEGICRYLAARRPTGAGGNRAAGYARAAGPVLGLLVLAVGLIDQSLTIAVPAYAATTASNASDQQFVDDLQARVPAGSMIFQLPWAPFSNSGAASDPPSGGQLALWLHSSSLGWSAGGISGRPQTDWPAALVRTAPAKMVRNLAAIGFAGITIDRQAADGAGTKWLTTLEPVLGTPTLTSQDQRYVYLPLARIISTLDRTTTRAQRSAIAESITKVRP